MNFWLSLHLRLVCENFWSSDSNSGNGPTTKGPNTSVPSKPGMLEVATRITVCLGCHNGFHVFCGLLSRVLRIDSCNCNAHSCILERKDVQGVIQCNVV